MKEALHSQSFFRFLDEKYASGYLRMSSIIIKVEPIHITGDQKQYGNITKQRENNRK